MTSAEPLSGAIALPDGTLIRGRGRREPQPGGPRPDFGLYLGRDPDRPRRILGRPTWRRLRTQPGAAWRPDWPADWIDWPDFGTPRDDRLAAAAIEHAYLLARAGQRVEVACGGGTGRTGTVLACLAILAGCPSGDAIAWTRRNYRPRAVETPGQKRWVQRFSGLPETLNRRDGPMTPRQDGPASHRHVGPLSPRHGPSPGQ